MSSALSKPGDLTLTPFLIETEDGKPVVAEWGRLLVPENRTQSGGNLIELPFVRIKATTPKKARQSSLWQAVPAINPLAT